MIKVTDEMLERLRESVSQCMGEKRYLHTLAVERMAERMALIYCPSAKNTLRAAALLHDTTKELDIDAQIELCQKYGVEYDSDNIAAKKTFHAMTAAALIQDKYPDLYCENIYLAVRYHTTGRAGMSLYEKIIYLADYIDDTRMFDECVMLRDMFWSADIENMSQSERLEHLDRVVLKSLDITISDLVADGKVINKDTVAARNFILKELNRRKEQNYG